MSASAFVSTMLHAERRHPRERLLSLHAQRQHAVEPPSRATRCASSVPCGRKRLEWPSSDCIVRSALCAAASALLREHELEPGQRPASLWQ